MAPEVFTQSFFSGGSEEFCSLSGLDVLVLIYTCMGSPRNREEVTQAEFPYDVHRSSTCVRTAQISPKAPDKVRFIMISC